jgi:hypothetical protein
MRLCVLVLAVSTCFTQGCVVVTSSCTDGVLDNQETDIDCGGPNCSPCGPGGRCVANRDCTTGVCAGGLCAVVVSGCSDGVKDGNETDVDCGGSCPPCAAGKVCAVNADCVPGECTGNICTPHPMGAGATPTATYIVPVATGVGTVAPSTGGYGITATVQGGTAATYRLVALAPAGTSSELYGSIFSAGGFSSITVGCAGNACATATIDFVSQPYNVPGGQRVDFDFLGPQTPAGFDADVLVNSAAEPLFFDLFEDGAPVPQSTQFTASPSNVVSTPAQMPFGAYVQ